RNAQAADRIPFGRQSRSCSRQARSSVHAVLSSRRTADRKRRSLEILRKRTRSVPARGERLPCDRLPAFHKDLRAQPRRAFPLAGSSRAVHFAKAASRFSFDPGGILSRSPWSNRATWNACCF